MAQEEKKEHIKLTTRHDDENNRSKPIVQFIFRQRFEVV